MPKMGSIGDLCTAVGALLSADPQKVSLSVAITSGGFIFLTTCTSICPHCSLFVIDILVVL